MHINQFVAPSQYLLAQGSYFFKEKSMRIAV